MKDFSLALVEILSAKLRGYQPQLVSETRANARIERSALGIWLCMVYDIASQYQRLSEARYIEFVNNTLRLPQLSRQVLLKRLDAHLIRSVHSNRLRAKSDYLSAASGGTTAEVKWVTELLSFLAEPLRRWAATSDLESFRSLHQSFVFLKRLPQDNDDLDKVAKEKWMTNATREYVGPEKPDDPEAAILARWFPDELVPELLDYPTFGSGVNSDAKSYVDKINVYVPEDKAWAVSMLIDDSLMQKPWTFCSVERPLRSELITVAKSFDQRRTITPEPALNMWMQQALMTWVFDYLKDTRGYGLAAHYCVDTSEWNTALARIGSEGGNFSTIDLSSASDSVRLHLVKTWMPKGILNHLLDYRTAECLVGESVVCPTLFAGMGSPSTFWVMTAILGAVVQAEVDACPYASKSWYVYGDDIVCDTEIVSSVVDRLVSIGFMVNEDKSYTDGPACYTTQLDYYRESCGGEFINGVDVAPIYLSRQFSGLPCFGHKYSAQLLDSAIDLVNTLRPFKTARRFVLKNSPEELIQFGSQIPEVVTAHVDNSHLRTRWNHELQRFEVRLLARVRRKPAALPGDVTLYYTLRAAQRSKRKWLLYPEDRIVFEQFTDESQYSRKRYRYEWRWVQLVGECVDAILLAKLTDAAWSAVS